MSRYDYEQMQKLRDLAPPFASLIMAALHKADSTNAAIIRGMWPDIAAETQARHDAIGGYLYPENLPDGSWWCDVCHLPWGASIAPDAVDETATVRTCSPECTEQLVDEALR